MLRPPPGLRTEARDRALASARPLRKRGAAQDEGRGVWGARGARWGGVVAWLRGRDEETQERRRDAGETKRRKARGGGCDGAVLHTESSGLQFYESSQYSQYS